MKKYMFPVVLSAISFALAVAAVYIPVMFLPFSIMSALLFSLAIAFSDTAKVRLATQITVIVLFSVMCYFTVDIQLIFIILMLFIPGGLGAGIAFTGAKKLNSAGAYAFIVGAMLAAAAFAMFTAVKTYPDFSIMGGVDALTDDVSVYISALVDAGGQTELYYSVEEISLILVRNLPAAVILFFLLSAVICYWFVKLVMEKLGKDVSFMETFADFRTARAGAVFYFIVTIISMFTSGTAVGTALMNYTTVMSFVFSYAGISLIAFYLELKNLPKIAVKAIIAVLFLLMMFGFSFILSLVGLIDAYIDVRNKLKNSGT